MTDDDLAEACQGLLDDMDLDLRERVALGRTMPRQTPDATDIKRAKARASRVRQATYGPAVTLYYGVVRDADRDFLDGIFPKTHPIGRLVPTRRRHATLDAALVEWAKADATLAPWRVIESRRNHAGRLVEIDHTPIGVR